ncbi:MAG: ABC transporter permease, partial [Vicinamibacteria bacterium]
EALGARLRSGRFLTADDNRRDARRVAVVNQAIVRQFFRNTDPVGRTIYFNGPYEIVGRPGRCCGRTAGRSPG